MDLLNTIISAIVGIGIGYFGWKFHATNSMRMAVVEKRFQAHQEAYEHVLGLGVKLVNDPADLEQTIEEANEWWKKNNLYLDPDARSAVGSFITRIGAFFNKSDVLQDASTDEVKGLVDELNLLIDILVEAVDLPSLKGDEKFLRL